MYHPPRFIGLRRASFLLAGWIGLGACGWGLAQELEHEIGSTRGNPDTMRGLEFGIRSGFGFNRPNTPDFGRFGQVVPIWVDVGYRAHANWYVSVYFEFGVAQAFDVCTGRVHTFADPSITLCSGSELRYGANVHYHFRPNRKVDPWVGLGMGYEVAPWQVTHSRAGYEDYSGDFSGFEFANLQLGPDYRDELPWLGIGPFVAITLAQASSDSSNRLHSWLIVGARLVFDVRLH